MCMFGAIQWTRRRHRLRGRLTWSFGSVCSDIFQSGLPLPASRGDEEVGPAVAERHCLNRTLDLLLMFNMTARLSSWKHPWIARGKRLRCFHSRKPCQWTSDFSITALIRRIDMISSRISRAQNS